MPRVELIYDMDCPNVQHARKALHIGFSEAGLQPSWTEWGRKPPESVAYARRFRFPTILVGGRPATERPILEALEDDEP